MAKAEGVPENNTEPGSFRDLSQKTGISVPVVHRSITALEKLCDEARERLRDEDIPNHHILELSKLSHDEQRQAILRYNDGETLLDAVRFIRGGTEEEVKKFKELASLNKAWDKARPDVRDLFLREKGLGRKGA